MSKKAKLYLLAGAYVVSSLFWGPWAEASFRLKMANDDVQGIRISAIDWTSWEGMDDRPVVQVALRQPTRLPGASEPSSGRCGGSLPTCGVMACESKGSLTAKNPHSSASGKWQIVGNAERPGTWNGYGGYSEARHAPEEVQDAKARELWANGAGRGHWRQCL